MKIRVLIIIGIICTVSIITYVSLPTLGMLWWSSYNPRDSNQILNIINENEKNDDVTNLSQETWDHLLSIPHEEARQELQEMSEKVQKPFMDVSIVGIKDTYSIGEQLEFTVVEAGYGNPCTHPRIIISQEGQERPHWEYWFVHSCPFLDRDYPVLNTIKVPQDNRKASPITEPGQYSITVYSRDNATDSRQFTVLPSDFVYDYTLSYTESGNSTGNTQLEINLNEGTYTIARNSGKFQNALDDASLGRLRQLIESSDILRGAPNMEYEHDESCRNCINHAMMVSLGNYTNYVKWQNDEPDMREMYLPIIDSLEGLIYQNNVNN